MECDVERLELLKELDEKTKIDLADMEDEEKQEINDRIIEINERLEFIDADKAESKAIMILSGLGFS